nr:hypothetical protein [Angustibacter aerolatus]
MPNPPTSQPPPAPRLAARLAQRVLRRAGVAAFALGPGRVVLDRRRPAARTHAVTERVWLVDAETDRTPTQVSHVDGGAWLVTRRDVDPLLETHTLKPARRPPRLVAAAALRRRPGARRRRERRAVRPLDPRRRLHRAHRVVRAGAGARRAGSSGRPRTTRAGRCDGWRSAASPAPPRCGCSASSGSIRDANAYGRERFEALDDDGTEVVEVPVHRLDALLDEPAGAAAGRRRRAPSGLPEDRHPGLRPRGLPRPRRPRARRRRHAGRGLAAQHLRRRPQAARGDDGVRAGRLRPDRLLPGEPRGRRARHRASTARSSAPAPWPRPTPASTPRRCSSDRAAPCLRSGVGCIDSRPP